ncbi:Helix-turn-helix domain protein [compost metagenome]
MRLENIERMVREIQRSQKPLEPEQEFLTVLEASKLINLAVPTIYSKVCRNEIPVNKQGKKLYFVKSELLEWIRSGKVKTIAEIHREVDSSFSRRNGF